jgi:hypothetical protein
LALLKGVRPSSRGIRPRIEGRLDPERERLGADSLRNSLKSPALYRTKSRTEFPFRQNRLGSFRNVRSMSLGVFMPICFTDAR